MTKQLFATTIAVSVAMGLAIAGQIAGQTSGLNSSQPTAKPVDHIVIQADKTQRSNGKQMFASYCAPCHGADGRGSGPVAAELKTKPVDLTLLSANNHGKFPSAHVAAVLQFGAPTPAHGTALMPVWGPILKQMSKDSTEEKQIRVANLTEYVQSIQAK